ANDILVTDGFLLLDTALPRAVSLRRARRDLKVAPKPAGGNHRIAGRGTDSVTWTIRRDQKPNRRLQIAGNYSARPCRGEQKALEIAAFNRRTAWIAPRRSPVRVQLAPFRKAQYSRAFAVRLAAETPQRPRAMVPIERFLP